MTWSHYAGGVLCEGECLSGQVVDSNSAALGSFQKTTVSNLTGSLSIIEMNSIVCLILTASLAKEFRFCKRPIAMKNAGNPTKFRTQ